MTVKNSEKKTASTAPEYWKTRFQQQKYMIGSMTSLLSHYGSSIVLQQLYSSFLLTLMGQFVVGDACYYEYDPDTEALEPFMSYGRFSADNLPRFAAGQAQINIIRENPFPVRTDELPRGLAGLTGIKFLSQNYRLLAPLFLKEKMIGVLFLGEKVSGETFSPGDLEVLSSLCAVSATTFNNALMYNNAQKSAMEIRKLYKVRDEVISRITHEFRTPLTILKAGVEMLAKDAAHKELVQLFAESENRLADLINSLLSLSQQAVNEYSTACRTDAITVLHHCIHTFSKAAANKNIQINMVQNTVSEYPPLNISKTDLSQILNALLENGIKFSPAGSAVTIEVDRLSDAPNHNRDGLQLPDWREQTENLISEYQDLSVSPAVPPAEQCQTPENLRNNTALEYLVVRISDNGIGIPEEDLLTVAEPFRQASNSPDLGIKGTGLGLALAHKAITRHGGYLCCRSTEGSGTKFSVFLPLCSD